MKLIRQVWIATAAILFLFSTHDSSGTAGLDECTAGVACARATTDGRPVLWKSRDAAERNNEVVWNSSGTFKFIAVINAGKEKSSWMGLNEKGFAIINTLSTDLGKNSSENGTLMTHALGACSSVDEFGAYLKETNASGRKTAALYGVIDAGGGAAFFETSGNQYWRYNAEDTPDGYIVKTNFSIHGGGTTGIERYRRSELLMKDFYASDKIDWKEIARIQVRDFSDKSGTPIQVPFAGSYEGMNPGFVPADYAICRNTTVSFAAIQGVLKGEPPVLSTMWTILGQPAAGVTVPYWPVGPTPPESSGGKTSPLCDAANDIRARVFTDKMAATRPDGTKVPIYIDTKLLRDSSGEGVWKVTLPVEDHVIAEGEAALTRWRKQMPDGTEILTLESKLAKEALDALHEAAARLDKK